MLDKVHFFRGRHSRFITAVCELLRPEFYCPGDVVIFQGDISVSGKGRVSWLAATSLLQPGAAELENMAAPATALCAHCSAWLLCIM